jgi:hypothetical protein
MKPSRHASKFKKWPKSTNCHYAPNNNYPWDDKKSYVHRIDSVRFKGSSEMKKRVPIRQNKNKNKCDPCADLKNMTIRIQNTLRLFLVFGPFVDNCVT